MKRPNQSPSQDLPLLRMKISAPRIPPEHVNRPRLIKRIERGVKGPLTLVAAAAGYGKTNLLAEWASKTSQPAAWLTLDSKDNDLERFFRYLIGAFQTIEPHLGEEALDFLESTRSGGVEVALTLLLNEISALPKELILILDDFQVINDAAILQSFDFFLKHLPPNQHLILSSRGEPALDLAFLRAKRQVVEINTGDLRFTEDEVVKFFKKAIDLELPREMVRGLVKRTDGWITALQMAALSLQNRADPMALLANLQGDAHYLVDFLAEEVLDRQPEEIRLFLLRSSVLNTLTGPLCEAVVKPDTQPGYGTVMLNRLEHERLFITALDEKHEWFRYHHLFADFLRHIHAEINPEEIPVLKKRAALWFEQNGNLEEASQYALSSGDMEWTADLIERNIQTMLKSGEIFTLTQGIGKLPNEIIQRHPGLSLAYAWGAISSNQIDLAQYWLDEVRCCLEQFDQHPDEIEEPYQSNLWNLRGGLAVCQSTIALLDGDMEQAAEFTRQASCYLSEENPFIRSLLALDESLYYLLAGDTQQAIESLLNTLRVARQANNILVMIIATCQLADMQILQGQLSRAWATLQKVKYLAVGGDGQPLPLAGLADVEFGEILLEQNQLEEARQCLERGIEATEPIWWLASMDGMISLARLRQAQGDVSGSQEIVMKAAQMALSTESSQWDDTIVSAVVVRLALMREDLATAEHWWVRGGFPQPDEEFPLEKYPYHVYEYLLLTQVMFLIVLGELTGSLSDLQQAIKLLKTSLMEAERFQRVASQIEILTMLARAQVALEDKQAKDTLLKALALAEPEGYRRLFLDMGAHLAELLQQCQTAQEMAGAYLPSPGFIGSLLEAIPRADGTAQTAKRVATQRAVPGIAETIDGLPISLSAREMEVLALIAEGKSNQEISAQLYLALNTVKRHVYNIYAKLGVEKRTQAILKARQLGLIP